MGIEADAFALADGLDGDDVPDVFGDDVADEEVDFFTGIDFAAGSGGFDAVASLGVESGGFDLDAEESAVEFDDGVVAVAVSPGMRTLKPRWVARARKAASAASPRRLRVGSATAWMVMWPLQGEGWIRIGAG